MKFRAKILDISLLQPLYRTINIISKQTKQVAVKITTKNIYFLSDQSTTNNFSIFSQIPSNHIFQEFLLEGVSTSQNQILFLLSSKLLINTLKQIQQNSKSVKFKLVQKQCLQFIEIIVEQPSNVDNNIYVTYDLPIQLISTKFWHLYDNFNFNTQNSDFSLYMPPFKNFKFLIDKMKNIEETIEFIVLPKNINENSNTNLLKLNVGNQTSNIQTQFNALSIHENNLVKNLTKNIYLNLDIKRLSIFLNSLILHHSIQIEMHLFHQKFIHLTFLQDQISLDFQLYHQSL